ncbi:ATP-dependent DNA helicase PIF1-like protein [Tanacetum coccineum]|uniref:ATP-dependent DNA helicase PIF1-like protein n=1 Tax=Tanacetum coccineum TaxID=301880 RepID=A0ABQ4YT65_9ASTR
MWYEEREEKSKTTVNLTFSHCCQGGKLLLPRFNEAPPPLNHLLSHNDAATSKFRDQIRVYNGMFCFTSFGAKIDHSINTSLFFDTQNEVRNRTSAFIDKETSEGVNEQIVGNLIQMLDQYSSVAKAFRMDAMALCRAYSNPDLFIMSTSNPKWPEISEMLGYFPGLKSHDRPEIGTRVFKIKLAELLDDLTKKHVFGKSRGVVYVIKFQKCGIPHAHILLWLEEHCKCKTPSEIDDIISTDLPSLTDDPDVYKAVTDYMLHGLCGKDARNTAFEGFKQPMTVNKRLCATFKEACFAYGLLNDGKEWIHALLEASLWALGPQLWDIFVTMLLFYGVSRPLKLWEENWQTLSEDILHKKSKLFKYPCWIPL